jgi:hypothetical protein
MNPKFRGFKVATATSPALFSFTLLRNKRVFNNTGSVRINVTLRRVRLIIVAVKNQSVLNIQSVRL